MTFNPVFMTLKVLVGAEPLPQYTKDGVNWIALEEGQVFSIQIWNETSHRIEVGVGVDGRNVLKDEPAGFSNNGYVIKAHSPVVVRGWRLDADHVREFKVTRRDLSVAVQATGSGRNLGVIGAFVFGERQRPVWRDSVRSFDPSEQLESKGIYLGPTRSSPIGVGMGNEKKSSVTEVNFERATGTPVQVIVLRYAPRQWLVEQGIISDDPNPFPGNKPGETGYRQYR